MNEAASICRRMCNSGGAVIVGLDGAISMLDSLAGCVKKDVERVFTRREFSDRTELQKSRAQPR